MKPTKSSPSLSARVITGGNAQSAAVRSGTAASAPIPGAASAVPPSLSNVPVVIKGQISRPKPAKTPRLKSARGPRRPRTGRVGVPLGERLRQLLVSSPLVEDAIEHGRRVILCNTAMKLMQTFSLNRTARLLGLAPSRLSTWLAVWRERGNEGLRPTRWNAGRHPRRGKAARHDLYLDFVTDRT